MKLLDFYIPDQPPFICSKCNKVYVEKAKLLRHIREVHLQLNGFVCQCGDTFSRFDQARDHVRFTHPKFKKYHPKNMVWSSVPKNVQDKIFALISQKDKKSIYVRESVSSKPLKGKGFNKLFEVLEPMKPFEQLKNKFSTTDKFDWDKGKEVAKKVHSSVVEASKLLSYSKDASKIYLYMLMDPDLVKVLLQKHEEGSSELELLELFIQAIIYIGIGRDIRSFNHKIKVFFTVSIMFISVDGCFLQ